MMRPLYSSEVPSNFHGEVVSLIPGMILTLFWAAGALCSDAIVWPS